MNSIQAIIRIIAEYFPKTLYKLSTIFQVYKKQFNSLNIFEFKNVDDTISNGYMSILLCKINNMLEPKLKQLRDCGINVANVYPDTISNQPGFRKELKCYLNGKSDEICKTIINLPNYYDLSDIQQKYIIDKVKNFDKIDIVVIGTEEWENFI